MGTGGNECSSEINSWILGSFFLRWRFVTGDCTEEKKGLQGLSVQFAWLHGKYKSSKHTRRCTGKREREEKRRLFLLSFQSFLFRLFGILSSSANILRFHGTFSEVTKFTVERAGKENLALSRIRVCAENKELIVTRQNYSDHGLINDGFCLLSCCLWLDFSKKRFWIFCS